MKNKITSRCFILIMVIFFNYNYLLSDEKDNKIDLGLGFGYTYGVIGCNIDANILSTINAFLGAGCVTDFDRFAWSAGFRYYFLDNLNSFRPRITAFYGFNSIIEYNKQTENGMILGKFKENDEGLAIAAGCRWLPFSSNNLGFDFDIIYAVSSEKTPYYYSKENTSSIETISKISFALGLRYTFNY